MYKSKLWGRQSFIKTKVILGVLQQFLSDDSYNNFNKYKSDGYPQTKQI